ncbi:MAG TPA: GatB/YqeY domain-containing protein [Coprothermobacter sp.]|nr:GatB/YqeY domain-containing protein [Coprothermobacter sp.]
MSLKKELQEDLKEAMKSKNNVKLEVVRSVLTGVKNLEVQKMREAEDEDVLQVIKQEVKKRKEAIEMYEKAGRTDLLEQEKAELSVLETYLPPLMSEEEVREVVKRQIEKVQPTSIKERGKIMGLLMQELKGKADGNVVTSILDEELEKILGGG